MKRSRRDLCIDIVVDMFSSIALPVSLSYPKQVLDYLKQALVFTLDMSHSLPPRSILETVGGGGGYFVATFIGSEILDLSK